MSHVERVKGNRHGTHLDVERCCTDDGCHDVIVNGTPFHRRDIEHALKALFGEVPAGTRWFDKQFREAKS